MQSGMQCNAMRCEARLGNGWRKEKRLKQLNFQRDESAKQRADACCLWLWLFGVNAIAIAIALEIYLKKFKYSVFIFFDKADSESGVCLCAVQERWCCGGVVKWVRGGEVVGDARCVLFSAIPRWMSVPACCPTSHTHPHCTPTRATQHEQSRRGTSSVHTTAHNMGVVAEEASENRGEGGWRCVVHRANWTCGETPSPRSSSAICAEPRPCHSPPPRGRRRKGFR
jgi:hypothetical protein